MKIGIIGGGIVGLSSAYYLNRAGCEVTILDQGDLTKRCSYGNAGMIVPSHIIPLASPGMIAKGIRWMFDSTSPFYVKPRFSRDLITWGYHFYRSATAQNVIRAIPALKQVSLMSKELYREWKRDMPFEFGYLERGLLMLYKTAEMEREESDSARQANENGVEAHVLSAADVQKLEPDVRLDIRGGVYFPGDAQLLPHTLMEQLIPFLKTRGVKIENDTRVTDFVQESNSIKKIKCRDRDLEFDEIIIAAGAWSGGLAGRLGLSLPMQAGKGYSFTVPDVVRNARIPSIFLEARVAVTPMGNALRFGGTMEITDTTDTSISMNRVRGIVEAIPRYYPDMKPLIPARETTWQGYRPCSPDGLPYIGRWKNIKNVVVATGHGMMGMSLAPATGKLVAEIITRKKLSMDIAPFDPGRF